MNLIEIYQLFHDGDIESGQLNKNALYALMTWKVIPVENTLHCPNGHALKLIKDVSKADGYVWRCNKIFAKPKRKKGPCNYTASIRKNTILSNSKLSVFQIVAFIYLWLRNMTLKFIMEEIEISQQTAVDYARFFRQIAYEAMIVHKEKIGGVDKTVEINDNLFGNQKFLRRHGIEGLWVFGGVERGSNKCFLIPTRKRNKETLLCILNEWILPGTILISNLWKEFDCLNDEGYVGMEINYNFIFMHPETNEHINTQRVLWKLVKSFIPRNQSNKSHLKRYLAKFMLIQKFKAERADMLSSFLKIAGSQYNPLLPREVAASDSDDSDDVFDGEEFETVII